MATANPSTSSMGTRAPASGPMAVFIPMPSKATTDRPTLSASNTEKESAS